jgi:hypothetical protein
MDEGRIGFRRCFVMDSTYEDVARRAYDLFVSRGEQHGHDLEDWLEAERQLASAGARSRATHRITSVPRAAKTAGRSRRRPA